MRFHNKPHQGDCKLKTDGLELNRVQVTKFVGVLVDEKLSWPNHINAVCKNVSKHISAIYKIKHTLVNSHLYMLCCSLMHVRYEEILKVPITYFDIYYKRKQSVILAKLVI